MGAAQVQPGFAEQVEQEVRKMQADQLILEIKGTKAHANEQMMKEFQKVMAALQNKDLKKVKMALRAFNFFARMEKMTDRFIECFEQISAIQEMLDVLASTNEMFKDLVNNKNVKTLQSVKTNLKKFKKQIKEYETQMDGLMEVMDSLFEEKESFWSKLWKGITGLFKGKKKEPNPEEEWAAFMNSGAMTAFNEFAAKVNADQNGGAPTMPTMPGTTAGTTGDSGVDII